MFVHVAASKGFVRVWSRARRAQRDEKAAAASVDPEAESAASAGGGIGGTVLVGQSWWSASLMEEYCCGAGGADISEYSCCGSDLPTQTLLRLGHKEPCVDVFAGCKVSGACSDGGALTLAAADVSSL